jgi:ribokinase
MTKPPHTIAVIGSINLDIVASGATLPRAGETVTGASLAYHPGGKGANQALAAQRLGAQMTMIGAVGADAAADQALALLRAGGVHLDAVQVAADAPTGVALIVVGEGGENQIVVAPGANTSVTADAIADLDLSQFDAIICQLEIPIATIKAVAQRVSGFFAINLAPAQAVSHAALTRADVIIVNETEAAFYGDDLHIGAGLVVVTLGAKGAVMYQRGKHIITANSPKVTPIDTTGAGDTFVGALIVALMEGQSRQEAMDFACAAGAAATLTAGAQPSLPSRETVLALMGAAP